MAIDGTWNLSMKTPMGEQSSTLEVSSAGGALSGTQSAQGNSSPIFEGTADGDQVSWKVSITSPMPLTLTFNGTVSGNTISGKMGAGALGSWDFSGSRA